MKIITSPKNPLVKAWRQLKNASGRASQGRFLAEGEHLSQEAMGAGKAEALIILQGSEGRYARWLTGDLPCYLVSGEVIKAISDSKTPQDILALCPLPDPAPLGSLGCRLVALNQVQDPGNVGAILRTADAAGNHGLLIDPGCADPFSPKALRASMGAVFRVPVCQVPSLPEALKALKTQDYRLIAGDLQGEPFFSHPPYPEKTCLLVGNEGAGLSREALALSDLRLKLPIPGGAESLNAAVAASLMIYDVLRQDLQIK